MTKELRLLESEEFGQPSDKGNLVGVQPYMVVSDYASEDAFLEKLDGYLAVAKAKGWLSSKTIVVFPEYVGTWLVAAGESAAVYRAETVDRAMLPIVLRHFFSFLKYVILSPARGRIKYAVFRMKSADMLRIYHSVFSQLANRYAVTLVAGSIVLPEITVDEAGAVKITGNKLYNTSLIYHPDGRAHRQVLHKIFPTPIELPYTEPGLEENLPVYDTPAGRLGVLNCADSWYAAPYLKLKSQGVQFLAVASYVEKDHFIELPWRGDNVTPAPPEFDSQDFLKITYDDAWLKYAMAARIHTANVHTGINVFLRGKFWDVGSDGSSVIMTGGKVHRGISGEGAALQNVWIS